MKMTLRTTAAQSRVAGFHFFTSQDDAFLFIFMARELVSDDRRVARSQRTKVD